ncbi:unnamed protein product [Heterobilharzia americana]|nr:unnamed protein product [Heterobilharzia americana]
MFVYISQWIKLKNYPSINVENFSSSWKDGLAFCALIHKYFPDLVDINALSPEEAVKNLELAFFVAETKLDVPVLISPHDVVSERRLDENLILDYVSRLHRAISRKFSDQMLLTASPETDLSCLKYTTKIKSMREEDGNIKELLNQWLHTVQLKDDLFKRESELLQRLRCQELEDRHAELEYELRTLLAKQDILKTKEEKVREEELIADLIYVVDKRAELAESVGNVKKNMHKREVK